MTHLRREHGFRGNSGLQRFLLVNPCKRRLEPGKAADCAATNPLFFIGPRSLIVRIKMKLFGGPSR